MTDVAIIGSGIAGLSAALYAARYELSTVVIGDLLGGATSTAWIIENYPGYKEIDGYDLIVKVKEQVEALGVEVKTDRVSGLEKDGNNFRLVLKESGETIEAKTVILAVGAARRKLNMPKEDEFSQGKGVHYCTTCDGPLYKGKTIGVVGGGDASIKGVNLAVQYAEKVYVFVRSDSMKAEPINLERLQPHIDSGKVEILYHTEIAELLGDSRLSGVKFKNGKELELDGLFIEIGAIPEVELAEQMGVALDSYGYIAVNNMMETNVPGITSAGDATNFFGHFKQDVTAAAMGAVAATSCFHHIETVSKKESVSAAS
jgi:thioredoxin reductase (NADPH)